MKIDYGPEKAQQSTKERALIPTSEISERTKEKQKACDELRDAANDGKVGDILAKHETLILQYYGDVQDQATKSFNAAQTAAKLGFIILIFTWAYVFVFDGLSRFKFLPEASDTSLSVGIIGTVSGGLIEFIAAITFWLYARAARQFGAFHICLERTHRYLLAYKIAEEIKDNKDSTLRDLVCIMANASMITRKDIESVDSKRDSSSVAPIVS